MPGGRGESGAQLPSMFHASLRGELIIIFEEATRLEAGFCEMVCARITRLNSWRVGQPSGTVLKCESYLRIPLCT